MEDAIEVADITAAPWQPGGGLTHCNQWTKKVADLVGAPLPQALANAQAAWLASPAGLGEGWLEATEKAAREWCDAGGFAVATWVNTTGKHGHIAPLTLGKSGVTTVAHVGKSVRRRASIAFAFGVRHVRYFTHHPKRVCEVPQA